VSQISESLYALASPQKRIQSSTIADGPLGQLLTMDSLMLQAAFDHDVKRGQLGRLGQKVLCPQPDSFNRQINGTVSGQNNDGNGGVDRFQPRDESQSVPVGQAVIEDRDIGPVCPPELFREDAGSRGRDFIPLILDILPQYSATLFLSFDN
jgi:hypothetical protein